jgi:hypothetical protein
MGGEDLTTFTEPVARDNEYQSATRFQPAIRVAQERLLCAPTVSRPQCPIVGWIQIKQAKALDRALYLQRIPLDDVGNPLSGLLGPIGIQLNTVAQRISTAGDNLERHAIASTRVNRGRRSAWELQKLANSLGFGEWKRVEAETTFALEAQS